MIKVTIIEDIFAAPETWERAEVEDVQEFLASRFDRFPEHARIYDSSVSMASDVTPEDEAGVERLGRLAGPLWIVVYPGAPAVWIPIAIGVVLGAASVALGMLLRPELPATPKSTGSPNNDLGERQNRARPLGRIPDIFGTVRSTPDLLSYPYRVYENNQEVEYAYFCIGRGSYDVEDIRDGDMIYGQATGLSCAVYGPGASPLSGAPQLTLGDPIAEPLHMVKRSSGVDNAPLPAVGDVRLIHHVGDTWGFSFTAPNTVNLWGGDTVGLRFTDHFKAGDKVRFNRAVDSSGSAFGVSSRLYEILTVTASAMTITNDAAHQGWAIESDIISAPWGLVLYLEEPNALGPFRVEAPDESWITLNFVAPSGLYESPSGTPWTAMISCWTVPASSAQFASMRGAPSSTGAVRVTAKLHVAQGGAYDVYVRQTSISNRYPVSSSGCQWVDSSGNPGGSHDKLNDEDRRVQSEVRLRDLFVVGPVYAQDGAGAQQLATGFGDVTTIYAATRASRESTASKSERRLNLLATRKIARPEGGGLVASRRVDDILLHVCFDSRIGRNAAAEVDVAGVRAVIAAAESYFGTALAIEFNGTFDQDDTSFEETAGAIVSAASCTAYRRAGQIRLKLERSTDDSSLLFNHRNKVPGSETRSVRFGPLDGNDGIEFHFTDAENDDAAGIICLPLDLSAINPRKVESIGIRNRLQAYLLAWRAWNKLRYQAVSVEFEGLQEADILVQSDRILVADNTRPETWDGEVRGQNGLTVTLSQPVARAIGKTYAIFLQLADGTVESMPVTISADAGVETYQVTLSRAPRLTLVTDSDACARTVYQIVGDDDTRERAFFVTEKEPQGRMTSVVRAVNYDARYYANDHDYLDGVVDADGWLPGAGQPGGPPAAPPLPALYPANHAWVVGPSSVWGLGVIGATVEIEIDYVTAYTRTVSTDGWWIAYDVLAARSDHYILRARQTVDGVTSAWSAAHDVRVY